MQQGWVGGWGGGGHKERQGGGRVGMVGHLAGLGLAWVWESG